MFGFLFGDNFLGGQFLLETSFRYCIGRCWLPWRPRGGREKKNIGFRHPNMNPTLYMLFQTGERDMLKVHPKMVSKSIYQEMTARYGEFLQVASRRGNDKAPRRTALRLAVDGGHWEFVHPLIEAERFTRHELHELVAFFRREDPKIPSFSRIFCLLTKGMLQPSLPFSGHFN